MYNLADKSVQFGRRGCSTSAAPLFNLSVSTVQFEAVRVFNAGEIFVPNWDRAKLTPLPELKSFGKRRFLLPYYRRREG